MGIVFRDLKPESKVHPFFVSLMIKKFIIVSYLLTDYWIIIIDLLLHESGHLMLSDFDLSVQSPSAGSPSIIQSSIPFWVRK